MRSREVLRLMEAEGHLLPGDAAYPGSLPLPPSLTFQKDCPVHQLLCLSCPLRCGCVSGRICGGRLLSASSGSLSQ